MPEPALEHAQLPSNYYRRMYEVEQHHWWHRGMRSINASLLGERLQLRNQRLLDAGCGTGGFLRWALDTGSTAHACGVDISREAIDLARRRVPEAELRVAPLRDLPFADASFDLVVTNDVLQHVAQAEVERSLTEIRRVLRSDGALLVRTNGACRARRERDDWRLYDRRTLGAALEEAGFRCVRVTYSNMFASLWALARGRAPRAPTESRHGIPAVGGRLANALGYSLLRAEARYLSGPSRSLPYGHTLLALAVPAAP